MKAKFVFNENLVKDYYKDVFFSKLLLPLILILTIPGIAASIYILNDQLFYGLALIVVSIFVCLALLVNHFKNRKIHAEYYHGREQIFEIEFNETTMIVRSNGYEDELELKKLKRKTLRKYLELVYVYKGDKSTYPIPKYCFNSQEWEELDNYFKNCKKAK